MFFWTRSCYFTREIELSSHKWRPRMFSLAELPKAVGFFSHSREDDEAFNGTLSALRDGIQREMSAQLGKVDPSGPRKKPSRILEKPPQTSVESMGENRNRRRS